MATLTPVISWLLLRLPIVSLLLLVLHVLHHTFFHPLSKVPGPWLARYSGIWRTSRYFRGTWLQDVTRLHEQYGPVVRIAPNEVSFVDEAALTELYGHGKPSLKTNWYDTWVIPGMGDSFFATRDRNVHRQIRKRVSGTYSMSAILAMEPLIIDVLDLNQQKLTAIAKSAPAIRLDQYVNYFTFDVVGQLSMGGPIGFLEQEKDVGGIIQSIHDGFYLMANMGYVPGQMFWMNNPVVRCLIRRFGGEAMNSLETFLGWLDERVSQRLSDTTGQHSDMLQYFIGGKTPNGEPVSKAEVMIEAVNILGAGADTTAVAILAVLGQLLTNEKVFAQTRAELDAAHAGLDYATVLPYRELEKLPYLSAVIRESMRLHPSITYQLPRVPPQQGVTIGPHHIPSSVACGISPAAMNRSHKLFSETSHEFIPDRWIATNDSQDEQKRLRTMEQSLTTFGMGSRSCVGRNLAIVEVYKYVSAFIRSFDAEIINKSEPWVTKSQWFSFQRDFWVRLKLREAKI